MVFIYVLELENNRYYVGKTNYPEFRIDQHFESNACAWTTKYKPLNKDPLIIPNCVALDEDKYTKQYMDKYGIDNVRGGTYCQLELPEESVNAIEKELNGAKDKCYICHESDHFANDCPNKNSRKGYAIL